MAKSTVPHESTVGAEVNVLTTVTLYDPDGDAITVPAEKAEKFLRQGYARQRQDLDSLLSEVEALADALAAPWRDYVAACQEAGAIDNAAQDTARAAVELLGDACNRLHLALHRQFPAPNEQAPAEEPDGE